ncbi:right-handed parallel beta-helix repeat-containing protein [Methanobacterium sp.]|uniref:right-handed parallel beta-helix repeat-containing protein n=1 Tax=Methanobacterium sp. TaxID=2164 RepID=UPI003D65264C
MVFADVHYANPGNYKSVLGAAGYSDTIIFRDGVYNVDEPIEVLKSWKLVAANSGAAVLRATESIHTVIDVWSSDVTVSGLVIDGNGLSNYGIHGNYEGHYAINGNFNGNTIINNKRFGVLLTNTNSLFSNNYVANNGEVGIGLLDSSTSTLTGNTVVGSGYTGIYLYNSPGSRLTGNVVNGNGGGGIFLRLSPSSWIQNNVANGNGWSGINLESSGSSAVVANTANSNHIAGLWLTGTDSTPIIGNTFQYNPYGAVFTSSNGNSFTYNTVTNNVYGVTSGYSNSVSNNLIMDNSVWGLNMDTYGNNLNNPTITDNQIYRNGIGIKLVGNNNILGSFLFLNNSVLANNYALEFTGNSNLLDGTQLFGNNNGLHLMGDNNVLTNLTVVYNTLNGVLIDGNGNKLNDSYFLNNTNGLIFNGNGNNINNLFFLNNTNALTLNGNNNLVNGSGALNGTNGIQITGTNNIISNNSVSNQNNTAMYINGNNIVTGNSLTDNNGTGLLIRSDNDVVDFLNMLGNTIICNGQGINIQGNNNHINNLLTIFNILLDNGYSLTITGNNNQMNNTILTLNRNGLQVIGNNNSFSNITSRFNNQTGIIFNGNNNTLNSSLLQNNTNGLTINGSSNHVNSTLIFNNTNGTTINGNNNNLTQNNIHNNTENGITLNGSNNTFIQNNITGNPRAILIENGTNNTLNYNRIAGNTHNLHNNDHGTVDAQYNWWGQNIATCITGMNINTNNQAVAVLNVPSGTINPGQIYNITVTLKSSTGEELALEIPSFLVQFFINNGGDVYPETAPMTNNSAWTQLQVFNPGSYTLTAVVDQQTLVNTLSTPVNSQPVTPHKILQKSVSSGVAGDGMVMLGAMAEARASESGQPVKSENFWDSTLITIPGYKNLDNMWGGQYIKTLLDFGFGTDNNGNISGTNTAIDAVFVAIATIATGGTDLLGALGLGGIDLSVSGITAAITGAIYTLRDVIVRYGPIIVNGLATAIRSGWSGATQWTSRIIQGAKDNLGPAYNFLVKYLPNIGVSTSSVTKFGFDLLSRASIPFGWNPLTIGINIAETLATIPWTATKIPWLTRIVNTPSWTGFSRSLTLGDITALGTGTIGPSEGIIKSISAGIDSFKAAAKDAYNRTVQPALDRFNSERAEYQKKGLVKYVQSKYNQTKTYVKETTTKAVKYYNHNVRPWMEQNVKPVAHKYLDPIVQSKTFKTIRNLPGIKQAADGVSWFARGLGIW